MRVAESLEIGCARILQGLRTVVEGFHKGFLGFWAFGRRSSTSKANTPSSDTLFGILGFRVLLSFSQLGAHNMPQADLLGLRV